MGNVTTPLADAMPRRPWPQTVIWRLRQFRYSVGSRRDPAVDVRLRQLLGNDDQWLLLQRLSAFDRAHHLRVYDLLRERSCDDEDVLRAALLHDVGKADTRGRAHAGHRAAKVVLGIFGQRLVYRLASVTGSGPRQGLYLAFHHPESGARLARATGASARCCELIAGHDARQAVDDPQLAALIAADEDSIR